MALVSARNTALLAIQHVSQSIQAPAPPADVTMDNSNVPTVDDSIEQEEQLDDEGTDGAASAHEEL